MNSKTKIQILDHKESNRQVPVAATPFLLGGKDSKDALMKELHGELVGSPEDMPEDDTIYGAKAYADERLGHKQIIRWYLGPDYMDNYATQVWHGEGRSGTWPYNSTELAQNALPDPFVYASRKTIFDATAFTPRLKFASWYFEDTGYLPMAGTTSDDPKGFPAASQLWDMDGFYFSVPGKFSADTEVKITFLVKLMGGSPSKWRLDYLNTQERYWTPIILVIDGAPYYNSELGYAIMPVSAQFKLPVAVDGLQIAFLVDTSGPQADGGTSTYPANVYTSFYATKDEEMPTIEITPPAFYRRPDNGIPAEDLSSEVTDEINKSVKNDKDGHIAGTLSVKALLSDAQSDFPAAVEGQGSAMITAPRVNLAKLGIASPLTDNEAVIQRVAEATRSWLQTNHSEAKNVWVHIPVDLYEGETPYVSHVDIYYPAVQDGSQNPLCYGVYYRPQSDIYQDMGACVIPFSNADGFGIKVGGVFHGLAQRAEYSDNSANLGGVPAKDYALKGNSLEDYGIAVTVEDLNNAPLWSYFQAAVGAANSPNKNMALAGITYGHQTSGMSKTQFVVDGRGDVYVRYYFNAISSWVSWTRLATMVDVGKVSDELSTLNQAVATLQGDGDGSVKRAVADAIAAVVASAPEDFDTLKEIADYIASDKVGAAQLATQVAENTENVGRLLSNGVFTEFENTALERVELFSHATNNNVYPRTLDTAVTVTSRGNGDLDLDAVLSATPSVYEEDGELMIYQMTNSAGEDINPRTDTRAIRDESGNQTLDARLDVTPVIQEDNAELSTYEMLNQGGDTVHPITRAEAVITDVDNGTTLADELSSNIKKVTWAELVALRDGKLLKPGQQYQITDYVTTSTQVNTSVLDRRFDLIVTASDTCNLQDECRATTGVEGVAYYSNPNRWRVWYYLDNDKDRFWWADTTNGKGVIYRLIDEHNNDCPYDFKNIKFNRYRIANSGLKDKYLGIGNDYFAFLGFLAVGQAPYKVTLDYDSSRYLFTFDCGSGIDASTVAPAAACNNHIEPYYQMYRGKKIQFLNDIVFLGAPNTSTSNRPLAIENNYIDGCCSLSSFETSSNNRVGARCRGLVLTASNNNEFGAYCDTITLYTGSDNTFGTKCKLCIITGSCNTFGASASRITFGEIPNTNNVFASGVQDVTLLGGCNYNRFDAQANYNTLEVGCNYCVFERGSVYNYFAGGCNNLLLKAFARGNETGDVLAGTVYEQYVSAVSDARSLETVSRQKLYLGEDPQEGQAEWVSISPTELKFRVRYQSDRMLLYDNVNVVVAGELEEQDAGIIFPIDDYLIIGDTAEFTGGSGSTPATLEMTITCSIDEETYESLIGSTDYSFYIDFYLVDAMGNEYPNDYYSYVDGLLGQPPF